MNNNTFREIAEQLEKAESILLFPHINIDGDAMGSCAAVCKALRIMGKQCWILIDEELPRNLQFMDKNYCTFDQNIFPEGADVSMCIDCSEEKRFPQRAEAFNKGKVKLCIDHHGTSQPICDYNYIDGDSPAAGVLVYSLLKELGFGSGLRYGTDAEMGEAIFAAITTDTGNFQYSNTNKACHEICADLYDWGIDANMVSVEIYENMRIQKLQVTIRSLENIQLIAGGLGAITWISKADTDEIGSMPDETESVIEQLRAISGVEIACFAKEKEPGVIRVSFRAKRKGNVAAIAQKFNGGGHIKAAGATLYMPLEEAVKALTEEIEKAAAEL